MHKNLLFNDRFYFRIFSIILVLILFSNCTTTENATRLEKWSWMIQEEDKIFESSISEFGKLKPLVERNKLSIEIENIPEDYTLIHNASADLSEEICDFLFDSKASVSSEFIDRINQYISTHNVNLDTLEKSFNYKSPGYARRICTAIPESKRFILDDILKFISNIKDNIDNPQRGNRKARLDSLLNRMNATEATGKEKKSELLSRGERFTKINNNFKEEVYNATDTEFKISEGTFWVTFLLIQIKGITSYPTNFFTQGIAVIGFIALINRRFSPRLSDRNTVKSLLFTKKFLFYDEIFSDNEQLLKDTHYILINDKENRLPGFDEFAAALDFQISNYEELHQYFLTKDGIQFRTKEIEAICEKYKCNRQPDMELLKKNAKATIEELKKRRMASSLLN